VRIRFRGAHGKAFDLFSHLHVWGTPGQSGVERSAHGGAIEPFATELAVTAGTIAPAGSGALEATLDVALIDYTGGIAEGCMVRGDNPVLMTMELVLEAVE